MEWTWAPLLEIEAQVPGSLAFPYRLYDTILDLVAATGARAVVPSAAGQRHLGSGAWLDRISLPLSEQRFLRDLAVRAPTIRGLGSRIGATYSVVGGDIAVDRLGGRTMVERLEDDASDPRRFRPWEVPALSDTTPPQESPSVEARLDHWITDDLAPALAAALSGVDADPIRMLLSVVFPSGARDWTLVAAGDSCEVLDGDPGDHDVANAISARALVDVIDGTRSWGDVLLAGQLRGSAPAFRARPTGLQRLPVATIFLYYALPYSKSARRAVLADLDAVMRGDAPSWLQNRR